MKNRQFIWDTGTSGGRQLGDMSVVASGSPAVSLTSEAINVNARPFTIATEWTAAGTPVGTLSFEVSNNGGVTWDVLDATQFNPGMVQPGDGSGTLHQTLIFPGVLVERVRMKYARTSGGTADLLKGRVVVG